MTANAHRTVTGDRWQLVVAEDCDEYLRATARRDAGAASGGSSTCPMASSDKATEP
jgi:hypothetical protein